MKFIQAKPEDVFRSKHIGYIVAAYEKLAVLFRETSDKVQAGWEPDKESIAVTIDGYKEIIPASEIRFWLVSGKGDMADIELFIEENGIDRFQIRV